MKLVIERILPYVLLEKLAESYSEPCLTSNMELGNGGKLLAIFTETPILDA